MGIKIITTQKDESTCDNCGKPKNVKQLEGIYRYDYDQDIYLRIADWCSDCLKKLAKEGQ